MIALIFAVGCVLAFFGWIIWQVARGTRAKVENEQKGAVIDAIRDHEKIKADVDALPARTARDELRDWSRR